MAEPMRLTCHCGANELKVVLAEGLESARRCDCSFCRRRGAMNVSVRDGDLRIIRGAALALYQFGPRRAEHYFCSICGCYTHHRRSSDTSDFGVNVGGLEGINPRDIDPVPWLDGVNYNPENQGTP
ncbi:GFA family protein [Roseobacter insulae]|nr:GFA family protein [Roseobacter insulae]